jgi:hypothetical protein
MVLEAPRWVLRERVPTLAKIEELWKLSPAKGPPAVPCWEWCLMFLEILVAHCHTPTSSKRALGSRPDHYRLVETVEPVGDGQGQAMASATIQENRLLCVMLFSRAARMA